MLPRRRYSLCIVAGPLITTINHKLSLRAGEHHWCITLYISIYIYISFMSLYLFLSFIAILQAILSVYIAQVILFQLNNVTCPRLQQSCCCPSTRTIISSRMSCETLLLQLLARLGYAVWGISEARAAPSTPRILSVGLYLPLLGIIYLRTIIHIYKRSHTMIRTLIR